ncbi:MAG TPA: hypothetical protein ENJ82_07630 [Bacteroidetes bacterium]|nr:hypothetical protein [Bacteroidota bacterium]
MSGFATSTSVKVESLDIARVIETLGTDKFTQILLDMAQPIIRADFISIFCLGDEKTPLLFDTKCIVGHSRAALAAKGYERHFLDDLDYQLMKSGSPEEDYTTYQVRDDINSIQYRRDCYDRPGIADRRSAVRKRAGYALRLSFYRSKEVGEFDDTDRKLLDGLLPMFLALTERHIAFRWQGNIATVNDNEAQLAISSQI